MFHVAPLYSDGRPNVNGGVETLDLEGAAALLGLDTDSLKWTIEEYGRCDTIDYVAWPVGTETPTGAWA